MSDHVYRKFSDNVEAIQALLQKDATFREICADYEEICTWLVDHRCAEDCPSVECDHARELVRDLENEINTVLLKAE